MQAIYISEMPLVTADLESALAHILLIDAFITLLICFAGGRERWWVGVQRCTFKEISIHVM